jgi:hypothetical protein
MVINRLIDSSLWLVFCILLNVQVIRQSDGPAIWGGCVTRRKHRAESWYFSSASWRITVQGTPSLKLRSPKEGMARVFAVMVQTFWLIRASRYNVSRSLKLSPYRIIIGSSGAVRLPMNYRSPFDGRMLPQKA